MAAGSSVISSSEAKLSAGESFRALRRTDVLSSPSHSAELLGRLMKVSSVQEVFLTLLCMLFMLQSASHTHACSCA
eukprot:SAG31_NODE_4393_length_3273_cov_2.562067_1_plen_76_part_00